MPPHYLKQHSVHPPPPPIEPLPLAVKLRTFPPLRLDREILNSPRFLILLITPEIQRCYLVLTPRPHFFEQHQEQNDASAANLEPLFSDDSIAPANKSLCPIDSEHKFYQERVPAWLSVGIALWSLPYKRAILTTAPY